MKLAIIVPGGVSRDGVDRVIHSQLWLIERLAQRHDVHIFALSQEPDPGSWDLLGARVHNVGTARGWRWRLFEQFATEHRRAPFGVIHAFFGTCGTYAACLGWRHRVPVLFHPSGGEFVALKDLPYGMRCSLRGRAALRVALWGSTRLTVATPYMQQLASALGVFPERVPIGVALDRWPPAAPRRRDPTRPARLLHVGDLRPVKDQHTLLAAAALLRELGIDFHLDIVGYDTMSGALQHSSLARELRSRTTWHGVLRRAPLRSLMESADLLLVTSRHEAGPLVVLEAAIAGVPTVGTSVGHVIEWAPEAAIAVPIGDAPALSHAAAALLADEPRRLAIATAAQRRALEIDADFTARAFERIYEELADGASRS